MKYLPRQVFETRPRQVLKWKTMNEPNKLIPAYLQATNVIVGFCMYAIPASDLQSGRRKDYA